MYIKYFKRYIDILISLIVLILMCPVLLFCIILLAFANNGNVFFLQTRPGKDEEIFRIIKFKTMNDKKDRFGILLSDEKRLTIIGKVVRKLSLDEMPQLINVIKGDMSFIGPRPLRIEYLQLYNKEQARRHEVLPGITGWAQVNGRNAITWEQKFKLDVWYVNNINFWIDLKIFFMTVFKVIKRSNVNQSETITMERFNGKN